MGCCGYIAALGNRSIGVEDFAVLDVFRSLEEIQLSCDLSGEGQVINHGTGKVEPGFTPQPSPSLTMLSFEVVVYRFDSPKTKSYVAQKLKKEGVGRYSVNHSNVKKM